MLTKVITIIYGSSSTDKVSSIESQTELDVRIKCLRYINGVLRVHRGRQVDVKAQAAVTNLDSIVDSILCHTTRNPGERGFLVSSSRILVVQDVQRLTVIVFEKRHSLVRCGCCLLHWRSASPPIGKLY